MHGHHPSPSFLSLLINVLRAIPSERAASALLPPVVCKAATVLRARGGCARFGRDGRCRPAC